MASTGAAANKPEVRLASIGFPLLKHVFVVLVGNIERTFLLPPPCWSQDVCSALGLGDTQRVLSVDIHPTKGFIAFGCEDSSVRLWNLRTKLFVNIATQPGTGNALHCRPLLAAGDGASPFGTSEGSLVSHRLANLNTIP